MVFCYGQTQHSDMHPIQFSLWGKLSARFGSLIVQLKLLESRQRIQLRILLL